jgi:4-diphosphocytidyl-2-C-methyl-D-erythritol kinase
MTRSVRLRSLGKINLDLRVLNRRADGYHDLRTVFQTISLADTLEIAYEPARRTALTLDDAGVIPGDIADNLVLRAACAVLDAMKVHAKVHFRLRKHIPMGGGLGGGSSNAAAVLLALPVLAGRELPFDELARLGAALGSDVPFFLSGGTAVALDRGTEIYGLPDVKPEPLLLVVPGVHVATGPAYQALGRASGGLTSLELSRKINDFQQFVRRLGESRSAQAAGAVGENDFEPAVFDQHPQLKTMWGRLRKYAAGARMTGSGSALFAVFGSKIERDAALKGLEQDRVFTDAQAIPATVVSGSRYRRLWMVQLREHLASANAGRYESLWPPRTRHAR